MTRSPIHALSLACALLLGAFAAHGQTHANSATATSGNQDHAAPQGPPPGERNPKLEAAMQECRKAQGISGDQRPDPKQMETCMSAKGFQRPKNGPQGKPPAAQNNN